MTLDGRREPDIEKILETGEAALLLQRKAFRFDILGTEVDLGHVFIFQSHATFPGGAEHVAALRNGQGAGRKVSVRASDDLPFVLYAPERLGTRTAVITGWGIDGYPEHEKLENLRRFQREAQRRLPGAEKKRH